jgi:hypothetical protein
LLLRIEVGVRRVFVLTLWPKDVVKAQSKVDQQDRVNRHRDATADKRLGRVADVDILFFVDRYLLLATLLLDSICKVESHLTFDLLN